MTIRKTVKSKPFDAATHDPTVIKHDFPSAEKLSYFQTYIFSHTYFLDLAAEIRLQVKNCASIRQLVWKIIGSILNQYKTVYIHRL